MFLLPQLATLYVTAGNTIIARCDRSDFDVFGRAVDVPGGDNVAYILALTDPSRFAPSSDPWPVEVLDFVIGR